MYCHINFQSSEIKSNLILAMQEYTISLYIFSIMQLKYALEGYDLGTNLLFKKKKIGLIFKIVYENFENPTSKHSIFKPSFHRRQSIECFSLLDFIRFKVI